MIRIFSNYIRLFSTLVLGIIIVPLTIAWLGDDAFGLLALLGANIGLARVFRQIIGQSLVRELAVAHHGGDDTMARLYPAICRVCLVAAVGTVVAFLLIIAAIPLLRMPDHYRPAAASFVLTVAVSSSVQVLLSPVLNMYLVLERFGSFSLWYVGERATTLVSVIVLGFVLTVRDPATGLLLHGVLQCVLTIAVYFAATWWLVRKDRRLRLTFRKPPPGAMKEVMGTFSWNSAVQVAMNLHEQVPPILLNLAFGPLSNAAWGIGFRLVAYIRMITSGMQFGSDAVSARLASGADPDLARRNLQRLTNVQTRLTALVSLPATAGVILYSFPILHLWVGRQLDSYTTVMSMSVTLTRVLALALAARAISDTWVLVLYGAGHVRGYARIIIAGGVIAPVVGGLLILVLPDPVSYLGPAISFTAAFAGLHFFGVPLVAARLLHLRARDLFLAVVRPLIATLLASGAGLGVLAVTGRLTDLGFSLTLTPEAGRAIDPLVMSLSVGCFCLVYAACAAFVLGPEEKTRLLGVLRKKLGSRTTHRGPT